MSLPPLADVLHVGLRSSLKRRPRRGRVWRDVRQAGLRFAKHLLEIEVRRAGQPQRLGQLANFFLERAEERGQLQGREHAGCIRFVQQDRQQMQLLFDQHGSNQLGQPQDRGQRRRLVRVARVSDIAGPSAAAATSSTMVAGNPHRLST